MGTRARGSSEWRVFPGSGGCCGRTPSTTVRTRFCWCCDLTCWTFRHGNTARRRLGWARRPSLSRCFDAHAKAQTRYPQTALLTQVSGVWTLTAMAFVLTIEDPQRFARSRDVGCYLGLRPKQQDSGERSPQLRITKAGDSYLRKMLVSCAHYIIGPFGPDTDLRRWGLKLCERGGKNAKKRAVVAVARKLAVLLHRLWVTGEVYEPLRS